MKGAIIMNKTINTLALYLLQLTLLLENIESICIEKNNLL